jgi:hypothetical protein
MQILRDLAKKGSNIKSYSDWMLTYYQLLLLTETWWKNPIEIRFKITIIWIIYSVSLANVFILENMLHLYSKCDIC